VAAIKGVMFSQTNMVYCNIDAGTFRYFNKMKFFIGNFGQEHQKILSIEGLKGFLFMNF